MEKMDETLYGMISKRRSFHLFRNIGESKILPDEIKEIYQAYQTLVPPCPSIRTAIRVVPA